MSAGNTSPQGDLKSILLPHSYLMQSTKVVLEKFLPNF
jgi:hypothetical protein